VEGLSRLAFMHVLAISPVLKHHLRTRIVPDAELKPFVEDGKLPDRWFVSLLKYRLPEKLMIGELVDYDFLSCPVSPKKK